MLSPIKLKTTIKIINGLHIWWSKWWIQVWWNDNPIIRNPMNNQPYIPWSSLKGRMRCLIEMQEKNSSALPEPDRKSNIWPIDNPSHIVAKSFGCAKRDVKIASRIIFLTFLWQKNFNLFLKHLLIE